MLSPYLSSDAVSSSPASPAKRQSEQPTRTATDYVRAGITGILLLGYLPVLTGIPRLLSRHLDGPLQSVNDYEDLFWAVPLALMCACLGMLTRWLLKGLTELGRFVWILALLLALAALPIAMLYSAALSSDYSGFW